METPQQQESTAETFPQFMSRERDRLHAERDRLMQERAEVDQKINQLDRDLNAIDAFEAAREGKLITSTRRNARSTTRAGRKGQQPARRGSKRDELLNVIRSSNGLKRGEIIQKMGLKGNKSGEMSVSNALTALVKSKQIHRENGKYFQAA